VYKRWERVPLSLQGQQFTCEVKRLNWNESREFSRVSTPMVKAFQDATAKENENNPAAQLAFIDSFDREWVNGCFSRYVRKVRGLKVEDGDDVQEITSGEELAEVAQLDVAFAVIAIIAGLAQPGGKVPGSASESPSPSPTVQSAGESIAPPASAEDGTAPATAQETPAAEPQSGVEAA
jgi:hypothetical protein